MTVWLYRDLLETKENQVKMEMLVRKDQKDPEDHRDHEDPEDHPYVNKRYFLVMCMCTYIHAYIIITQFSYIVTRFQVTYF